MSEEFIDYYELMQISPNAEAETIQRVFRMLAARYHPDNSQTGDGERFLLLTQAYRVLSDLETRRRYDQEYQAQRTQPLPVFESKEFSLGVDGEANRRMGILCLLYHKRRTNPDDSGYSLLEFEKLMSFPREHLIFTVWYLREKGYVCEIENSDIVITAEGVDYVEKNLPSNRVLYKLLKAAETGTARASSEGQWFEETGSAHSPNAAGRSVV